MSKCIDKEKLIAEIEKWSDGKLTLSLLTEIKRIIDSLQQEQQKPNLEKEIEDFTETLYHETFGNGQGTLDEFDWEDIAQIIDDTARYFCNLRT